jgi:hypothetical protein
MWRNRVDHGLVSMKGLRQYLSGKKMATIPMIPIGSVITLNRSILRTERRMSGTGGDDFICGHCGYVILEDFDPSTVRGNPVYQCGICENKKMRGRSAVAHWRHVMPFRRSISGANLLCPAA